MSLVAWNQLDPKQSPFVMVFERIGIPAAAGIINFVVLTAAASACNSGIFSTGRMLYTLAQFGQAPKAFAKVSSRHVPAAGVTVSACIMLVGVLLNYLVPEKVFVYASSVVVVAMLWTWAMIVLSHLRYRRAVQEGRVRASSFRMPGWPYANWFVLAAFVVVVAMLGADVDSRIALYAAPIWFGILALSYRVVTARADSALRAQSV
jgi:AAT family amino acid transporter/D-serine/D-alanine/glycine transporter